MALYSRIVKFINGIDARIAQIFFGNHPYPNGFSYDVIGPPALPVIPPSEDLRDNGFLFAVPKSRRTIEKRLKRKFGWRDHVWKLIEPKNNLVPCKTCGHHHEAGYLCRNCYSRIMKETQAMQDQIQADLQLNPVDKEVVVLYEGEKESSQFWQGKRIVEMKKPRPSWFSRNLLQKTTRDEADTPSIDVKSKDLA